MYNVNVVSKSSRHQIVNLINRRCETMELPK